MSGKIPKLDSLKAIITRLVPVVDGDTEFAVAMRWKLTSLVLLGGLERTDNIRRLASSESDELHAALNAQGSMAPEPAWTAETRDPLRHTVSLQESDISQYIEEEVSDAHMNARPSSAHPPLYRYAGLTAAIHAYPNHIHQVCELYDVELAKRSKVDADFEHWMAQYPEYRFAFAKMLAQSRHFLKENPMTIDEFASHF